MLNAHLFTFEELQRNEGKKKYQLQCYWFSFCSQPMIDGWWGVDNNVERVDKHNTVTVSVEELGYQHQNTK